ncbi:hypothetical protein Tco_0659006 [Tanacetum coccineum]
MSDFEDSTVTYIAVSSPFADLPDIGSPGVDGPPVMPEDPYAYVVASFQAPPSPDYVPGPEYPSLLEFVLEPVYPEFMPSEDEILPAEEQPLPAAISPTTKSPSYVPKSDPEEDPEEDDDEDPEEDPDEDVDIEGDEEEEEHPAPADSTAVALPAIDQAPSAEETELFKIDESAATPPPHPAYRVTARISIRDETPISLPPREEVERLLAMPTPPSSPLSPWSSPLPQITSPPLPSILSPLPVSPPLPQIPSPPLPVSSPTPVLSPSPPASPIRLLGYRAVMIRLRAKAASTSHSLPLPSPIILSHTKPDAPSSGTPPLHLLSTGRKEDRPEVTLPPRKRLGIAVGPRYEIRESSSTVAARPAVGLRADYGFVATMDREIRHDLERDVGYGITESWDEIVEAMQGTPVVTDVVQFSQRMTEFETRVRVISSSKLPIGQDHKERITGYVKKAQEKGIFTLISLSEETQHVTSQIATLAIRVCTYEDEVLPVEEQPLPAAASPTAQSPDYVPESDSEEDDGEDPKEDHVDYPADGGRRPDMRMIHLMDYEEGCSITDPFKTYESSGHTTTTACIYIALQLGFSYPAPVPIAVWSDAEVARLLAIFTPPSSPLSPWSSPLPKIPSPPLPPILSPLPISLPLPQIPSPPLQYHYQYLCYLHHHLLVLFGTPVVTDVVQFSQRMTEFETRVRRDTDEVYMRLDDEKTGRQPLAGGLNMLFRERRAHARTARLMKTEARMSRVAWG